MALIKTGVIQQQEEYNPLHQSDADNDFVICKSPDKLKRLLDKLKDKRDVHFVSDGDWSMHDLVNELLKKYAPAEIYITTYALREFAARQLINAMEKRQLKSINLLIDYKAKARTPEVFQLASMTFSKIFLTSIHAKVTVIKSAAGNVTINASANWTTNPRIEAGVISTNDATADFYVQWIENVMNNAEIFS